MNRSRSLGNRECQRRRQYYSVGRIPDSTGIGDEKMEEVFRLAGITEEERKILLIPLPESVQSLAGRRRRRAS